MKKNTSEPIPFLQADSMDLPSRQYGTLDAYLGGQYDSMGYSQSPQTVYASIENDQVLPASAADVAAHAFPPPIETGLALSGMAAYPTPSYILTNGNVGIAYASDGTPLFTVPMDDLPPVSPVEMPPLASTIDPDLEANQSPPN